MWKAQDDADLFNYFDCHVESATSVNTNIIYIILIVSNSNIIIIIIIINFYFTPSNSCFAPAGTYIYLSSYTAESTQ